MLGFLIDGLLTIGSALILPLARGWAIAYSGIHGVEILAFGHFKIGNLAFPALVGLLIALAELLVFTNEVRPRAKGIARGMRDHLGSHYARHREKRLATN